MSRAVMTDCRLPVRYRVSSRVEETHDTVTITLEPADDPIAAFRPGQFMMLYSFGVGEIPISVSGPPGQPSLTHTIRSVGAVSASLCAAQPGQVVGVRGPFGTSWDDADSPGGDLLLVAGGIGLAPLRPALLSALAQPGRYRRIILLAGARSPAELVFAAEYGRWRDSGAEVGITVDRADASWPGQVGVVTQLIGQAHLDPLLTAALICGPEVMMRITARSLTAAGLPAASIWISLERNMQCGTAECGHCQLGPLLLCRDGPVVNFKIAEPLLAVKEL
ncbi:MAG TPA: FAD/NAD(P)-binding protein [Streptosporangiaceae bacterium]|nr:FAD/NAD(P)-binding protein [Streptosporangiaceae bacterium]